MREQHANEFALRVRAGEFKDRAEKLAYLDRIRAVIAEEEASWRRFKIAMTRLHEAAFTADIILQPVQL
jgi:predicted adenine nucleotide alpha hydrolase (AANH) superfamily ATPase